MNHDLPFLSICITQYNEKLDSLLTSLTHEINTIEPTIEIIIRDDCSHNQYHYSEKYKLRQYFNNSNVGRAKNRNLLSRDARGKWILFLDGDSQPVSSDFIAKYLESISSDAEVIVGGTRYELPEYLSKCNLHFRYGKYIETVIHSESKSFQKLKSNNFLVRKDIISKFPFDETLKGYGHEDSELSHRLTSNNININQLNNPVYHIGIESNKDYIIKQEEAIRNLILLEENGYPQLSTLQTYYDSLGKMSSVLIQSLLPFRKTLRNLLVSGKSTFCLPLKALQLYKLLFYISIKKQHSR